MDKNIENPAISVLMPVYNAEKFVREAIDSILNQTFTNFEFLIFNDGSTDSSGDIIKSYKDERIRFFDYKKNTGYVKHLNEGLELSKGKYIARMDADDISLPTRFEKQIKILEFNNYNGLIGSSIEVINNGIINYPEFDSEIRAYMFLRSPFAHPTIMFRKQILTDNQIKYDNRYMPAEDYDLYYRMSAYTCFYNIPEPLLKYRYHDNQISIHKNKIQIENYLATRFHITEKLLNQTLTSDQKNLNDALSFAYFDFDCKKPDFPSLLKWSHYLIEINNLNQTIHPFHFKYEISQACLLYINKITKNKTALYYSLLKSLIFNYTYSKNMIWLIQTKKSKYNSTRNRVLFSDYYSSNAWGDDESYSGTGSNLAQTKILRENFIQILSDHKIKTLLDIPCGDFYWMKEIKEELEKTKINYEGADLVSDMIRINNIKYSSKNIKFLVLDLIKDKLPKTDLIFCRDCLVHFSYPDIYKALKQLKKSKSSFLLTTTFVNQKNKNISTGDWRPLNLEAFPFYFKKPDYMLIEGNTEMSTSFNKALGLWKIKELSLYKALFCIFLYYFLLTLYYPFIIFKKIVRKLK